MEQSFFQFLNHQQYVYNENNKSIKLYAYGGSTDNDVIFSGQNVVDGTLVYETVGTYDVTATKPGTDYYNDTSDNISIEILKNKQLPLFLESDSFIYNNENFIIDISGGNGTGSIIITGNDISFSNANYYLKKDAGIYEFQALKEGILNYHDISQTFFVLVEQSSEKIAVDASFAYYTPFFKENQNYISLNISRSDFASSFQSNSLDVIIQENKLFFNRPNVKFNINIVQKDPNYIEQESSLEFEIFKTDVKTLKEKGIPLNIIKSDIFYTNDEIIKSGAYTLNELIESGYSIGELKSFGYSVCALYNTKKFSLKELENNGFRIKYCIR